MPLAEFLGDRGDRFDDVDREALYALAEVEAEQCSHCGNPRSECSDHERTWYPQRLVCFASMERAAAQRRWDQLHDARPYHDGTFTSWAKESDPEHPYHYNDGVTIWVNDVDLSPDDEFLAEESPGTPPQSLGVAASEFSEVSEEASPIASPMSPKAPKK